MSGYQTFDHDLQTTPLQFVKDYPFKTGSTNKIEISFRNERNLDIIGKVRIYFSDPPEFWIIHCISQKGFLSNFPKVPNKIWEIQRIKDDSNNKMVIHYHGALVANEDISGCDFSSEEDVKKILFYASSAPDFYRAKPGNW